MYKNQIRKTSCAANSSIIVQWLWLKYNDPIEFMVIKLPTLTGKHLEV